MTFVSPKSAFSVADAVAKIQASHSASQPSRIASPPVFAPSSARQPVIVTPRPIPEIKTPEGSPQEYHTPPKFSPRTPRGVESVPSAQVAQQGLERLASQSPNLLEEDEVVGPEAEEQAKLALIAKNLASFRANKPKEFSSDLEKQLHELTEGLGAERLRTRDHLSDEFIDQFLKKAKGLIATTHCKSRELKSAFEWIFFCGISDVSHLNADLYQSRRELYRLIEERIAASCWFAPYLAPTMLSCASQDMCRMYKDGGYWGELLRLSQGHNRELMRHRDLTIAAIEYICEEAQRRVGGPELDYDMLCNNVPNTYDRHLDQISRAFL